MRLTDDERLNLVWDQAEFIAQRRYYSSTISLFSFEDFFVEVFFESDSNNISGIIIQDHIQILYSYVCNLDLTEIQKLLSTNSQDSD